MHKKISRLVINNLKIAKTTLIILLILIHGLILSGCGLLPKEEELKLAPELKEYEVPDYKTVRVEKGDLTLNENITCTYSELKKAELCFQITDKIVDSVYYRTGDAVNAGDLIASLDLGDMESQVEELQYSIGKLKLIISQQKELMLLKLEKEEIILKEMGQGEDTSNSLSNIENNYQAILQSYEDTLYIQEKKLKSLLEKIESYKLYATMDGTIAYIKNDLNGAKSTKGEIVVEIIDSSSAVFQANTEYTTYFSEDEEITVTTNKKSYQTYAKISKDEPNTVYFSLQTPDTDLKIGEKGEVRLTLDNREDTLYLPKSSVFEMKDSYFVYYTDNTGIRNYKAVEVGLSNDEYVEILSGLEYGEIVQR